jgi:gas vesicle protein
MSHAVLQQSEVERLEQWKEDDRIEAERLIDEAKSAQQQVRSASFG